MILKEGIILKSIKYQENSKIVSVINSEGIFSYLVRNANSLKSKNYCYSMELTKIGYDVTYSKKNSFDIITSGTVIDNYSEIKKDYEKIKISLLIMEIANSLGNHVNNYETFYLFLSDILKLINETDLGYQYSVIFRLKCLYLFGIGPVFSNCVSCNTKEKLTEFDFYGGGMKCKNCSSQGDLIYSGKMVEVLKFLYLTKLNQLSVDIIKSLPDYFHEINVFLNDYYLQYIGFTSRVNTVISKMKKM